MPPTVLPSWLLPEEPFNAHRLLINAIRVVNGDLRDLDLALESGADVNQVPGADHEPQLSAHEQGAAPLMLAVLKRCPVAWVDRLLNAGANPNVIDGAGRCPLLVSARQNNGEVVARLLAGGADPMMEYGSSSRTQTLVHLAAREERADQALRSMVGGGVAVDLPDMVGDTPLHHAAWVNSLVNVQTLLDLGADPTVRNREQRTALDLIATSGEHAAVRQVLEQAELRASFPEVPDRELARAARPRL